MLFSLGPRRANEEGDGFDDALPAKLLAIGLLDIEEYHETWGDFKEQAANGTRPAFRAR
jgi:hypothetical protein